MSTLVKSQTALFFLRSPAQAVQLDQQHRIEKNIEMKAYQRDIEIEGKYQEEDESIRKRDLGTNNRQNKRTLGGGVQYNALATDL